MFLNLFQQVLQVHQVHQDLQVLQVHQVAQVHQVLQVHQDQVVHQVHQVLQDLQVHQEIMEGFLIIMVVLVLQIQLQDSGLQIMLQLVVLQKYILVKLMIKLLV